MVKGNDGETSNPFIIYMIGFSIFKIFGYKIPTYAIMCRNEKQFKEVDGYFELIIGSSSLSLFILY